MSMKNRQVILFEAKWKAASKTLLCYAKKNSETVS